jgi:hypothetical protein
MRCVAHLEQSDNAGHGLQKDAQNVYGYVHLIHLFRLTLSVNGPCDEDVLLKMEIFQTFISVLKI